MRLLEHMNSIINTSLTDVNEVHKAVIEALYRLYAVAEDDNSFSQKEMIITSANGGWLEEWGGYFNVFRKTGENDPVMRNRVLNSINQPKITIPAMKYLIAEYLNAKNNGYNVYTPDDIEILESYKNTLVYSHKDNSYSENFRYTGGSYGRCIIQITIPENITPDLLEYINNIKAAGVQIKFIKKPLQDTGVVQDYAITPIYRHYYVFVWVNQSLSAENLLHYSDYYKGRYSDDKTYSRAAKVWFSIIRRNYGEELPFRFTSWQSPLHSFKSLFADFNDKPVLREIENHIVKINTDVEITAIPKIPY